MSCLVSEYRREVAVRGGVFLVEIFCHSIGFLRSLGWLASLMGRSCGAQTQAAAVGSGREMGVQ